MSSVKEIAHECNEMLVPGVKLDQGITSTYKQQGSTGFALVYGIQGHGVPGMVCIVEALENMCHAVRSILF